MQMYLLSYTKTYRITLYILNSKSTKFNQKSVSYYSLSALQRSVKYKSIQPFLSYDVTRLFLEIYKSIRVSVVVTESLEGGMFSGIPHNKTDVPSANRKIIFY